jgi:hypothetical protein
MRTMSGTPEVTFSTLFADTLNTHGMAWAWNYYGVKGKMSRKEFRIWAKATYKRSA